MKIELWKKLPLSSKIAVLTSLLVLGLIVGLTQVTIQRERSGFEAELQNEASVLLSTIAFSVREPLFNLEIDELAEVAAIAANSEEITLVRVYDADGRLLVDAFDPNVGLSQETDPLGETLTELGPADTYFVRQSDQLVTGTAVTVARQTLGAVAVGYSTAPLQQKLAAVRLQSIVAGSVALIAGIVLALIFARQITRPLSDLATAATRMAQGDRSIRVKSSSEDEIGQLAHAFNLMADAIDRRQQELEKLAASLEEQVEERTAEINALVASMSDVVLVIDREGRYVRVEPTAADLLHKPLDELVGKTFHEVLPRKQADEFLGHIERSLGTRQTLNIEYSMPIREKEVWFDASLSPMAEDQVVWVARDITGRKRDEDQIRKQNLVLEQTNRELEEARRKAEEANRLKSEFLATMSHELRTPLNAIVGYSQMILAGMTGELGEKLADYQDRIFANGRHLMSLINDILDLAKIEAGRMDMVKVPFSLQDWLDEVTNQTQVLAEKKGLTFRTALDRRMPEVIMGDPDRLKQIILNLLSNAVKFTDEGTVELSLQRQGKNTWVLEVKDSGVGIPSHAQEYIFDEFRQVDGTSRRQHGGTGLGLAIVRNLTMMMGGNVRVTSQVGAGSTFRIVLPLATENQVLEHIPEGAVS